MTTITADTAIVGTTTPRRSVAWWGMAAVIATEAMVFAILLAAWLFLRARAHQWPPAGTELPDLRLTVPFSFVLWGSSIPVLLAERSIRRARTRAFAAWMAIAWVMGAAFLAYTIHDFDELHFGWRDSAYASAFYVIVGLHAIHVAVGLGMSLVVQAKAWTGRYRGGGHKSAEVVALYWHFVDAVWLAVMAVVFLGTHIR